MAHLLNTSSVMMCPHGGSVTAISSNTRAKAGGDFILRSSDTFIIAGCAFNPGSPHPCLKVNWVSTGLRSTVVNNATLNEQSVGMCVAGDQAVQGAVQIASTQTKVAGQ